MVDQQETRSEREREEREKRRGRSLMDLIGYQGKVILCQGISEPPGLAPVRRNLLLPGAGRDRPFVGSGPANLPLTLICHLHPISRHHSE